MSKLLTTFEIAYIECMLWSSIDDNGEPMDTKYSLDDIAGETLTKIRKDCDSFIERAGELLDDLDDSQAGHDFWLTRNRHGAGFWDRGLREIGHKLTEISHEFGEIHLYVGDDGKLYLG